MSQPDLVPIAYEQFVADVQAVAAAIEASGWKPDHIVGIGRGGLVPGAYLSHRTWIIARAFQGSQMSCSPSWRSRRGTAPTSC